MKVNLRHTLYEKEKASIEVESGCIGVDPGVVWGFNGTAFLLLTRKRQQSCQMILKIEQTSFHYASTYRSMYTHCVCLHISISKLIYLYMHVCMYKCMYVCMYSTVQCSAVQHSTVQYSTVSTVQNSAVSTVQYSAVQYSTFCVCVCVARKLCRSVENKLSQWPRLQNH